MEYTERTRDETQLELIASFLDKLSEDYEIASRINPTYLQRKVEKFFRKKQLSNLSKDINASLELEDIDTAEQVVVDFHKLETPSSYGIDLFKDPEIVRRSFEEEADPILKMPGDLGRFINGDLCPASKI